MQSIKIMAFDWLTFYAYFLYACTNLQQFFFILLPHPEAVFKGKHGVWGVDYNSPHLVLTY